MLEKVMYASSRHKTQKKPGFWIWVLGPGPKPKTQRDPDSEFNSIQFCIEINKCLKFVRLKNKFIRKIKEIFLKKIQICHKF